MPDIDKWLNEALNLEGLHNRIHEQSEEWFKAHIKELYEKYHLTTSEWLVSTAEENGPFASIPPSVRMAAYCIGAETVEYMGEGAYGPDFIAGLCRILVMLGWHLREDVENGRFTIE